MAILYRQLIHDQIRDAKFPYMHRQLAESKILEVLRYLRVDQKIKKICIAQKEGC